MWMWRPSMMLSSTLMQGEQREILEGAGDALLGRLVRPHLAAASRPCR